MLADFKGLGLLSADILLVLGIWGGYHKSCYMQTIVLRMDKGYQFATVCPHSRTVPFSVRFCYRTVTLLVCNRTVTFKRNPFSRHQLPALASIACAFMHKLKLQKIAYSLKRRGTPNSDMGTLDLKEIWGGEGGAPTYT
jgi:hypothetical protein